MSSPYTQEQGITFGPDQSDIQSYLGSYCSSISPQTHEIDQSDADTVINSLHRRIAVLETQLARAHIDRTRSDQVTVYLLKLISAAAPRNHSPDTENGILDLKRQIRRITKAHIYLAQELRQRLSYEVRTTPFTTRGRRLSEAESPQRLGCQLKSLDRLYRSSQAPSSLINLLDHPVSDTHIPDLYHSDQSSVSEDDLVDIGDPLPDLPKIDLGLYGRKFPESIQGEGPLRFSASGRDSYFRHFVDNKMDSFEASDDEPNLSLLVIYLTKWHLSMI